MSDFFVAVAGNIGSGKTTLTRHLSNVLGVSALYESTTDNPYLEDFYADMPRYSLALQLRFLGQRVEQVRDAVLNNRAFVQDRTCYEDVEIFARHLFDRGEMDRRDFDTYSLIANQLLEQTTPPTLVVYLQRSGRDCARNVQKRGRDYEQSMPPNYLSDLAERYDTWFERYNRGPKLRLAAEDRDFVADEELRDELVLRVIESLPQTTLQLDVD